MREATTFSRILEMKLRFEIGRKLSRSYKVLGLHPEWAVFRDMWRAFISGRMSNPS